MHVQVTTLPLNLNNVRRCVMSQCYALPPSHVTTRPLSLAMKGGETAARSSQPLLQAPSEVERCALQNMHEWRKPSAGMHEVGLVRHAKVWCCVAPLFVSCMLLFGCNFYQQIPKLHARYWSYCSFRDLSGLCRGSFHMHGITPPHKTQNRAPALICKLKHNLLHFHVFWIPASSGLVTCNKSSNTIWRMLRIITSYYQAPKSYVPAASRSRHSSQAICFCVAAESLNFW